MTTPVTDVSVPSVSVVQISAPIAVLQEIVGATDFLRQGHQFTQDTPATVWTVIHDLGFDPAGITVIDADGYHLDGFGIQYLESGKSLRLSFDLAYSGVVYLS